MHAVGPDVDVLLPLQGPLAPGPMFLLPGRLEPGDGVRRESWGVGPKDRLESLGEVAGADPLEVEPRDQFVQALGPPQIGRQDCGCERLPLFGRPSILDPGLLDLDRTEPGEDGPLGVRAVADDLATSGLVLEVGMIVDPGGDLGLDGPGEHLAGSAPEDLGQDVLALGQWHDADLGGRLTHGGVLLDHFGRLVVCDSPRVRRPFHFLHPRLSTIPRLAWVRLVKRALRGAGSLGEATERALNVF